MVIRIFLLIFIVTAGRLHAQTYEFSDPFKLDISMEGEEFMPLLSPDGIQMFFGRALYDRNIGGKLDISDVWTTKLVKEGWKQANNTDFPWNTVESNLVIGMNAQGNVIYSMNTEGNKKTAGVYYSKRVKNGWTKPQLVSLEGLAQDSHLGMFMAPTEDAIIVSMKGPESLGEEDLYVILKGRGGKWSEPKHLGATVNSKGYEIAPFLSPDKKKLFFSSNGHPGMGDADIFYSERLYNSWKRGAYLKTWERR